MKKSLGEKVEIGMKLVPIPLSLLLAGTMAVTVQAEEVSSETEGNQVQNNQATPPINQELPNDGTIKNTLNKTEGPSGLTISAQGENGAAQVTPEIKQLAQEFYDYHTQEERDEITKAATMTSVMPEIQSVEQIEEAAKKRVRDGKKKAWEAYMKPMEAERKELLQLLNSIQPKSIFATELSQIPTLSRKVIMNVECPWGCVSSFTCTNTGTCSLRAILAAF